MFEKHSIRECFVRLEYLSESSISAPPKKKLLPTKKKLRSEVSWLPTTSSVLTNSSGALSTLAVYQEQNGIQPAIARKNVRRQRAKSMFATRENDVGQSNDLSGMKISKDDIFELHARFNSPNFGLKSSGPLKPKPKPQPAQSDFQKIFDEFKKRVEIKKNH